MLFNSAITSQVAHHLTLVQDLLQVQATGHKQLIKVTITLECHLTQQYQTRHQTYDIMIHPISIVSLYHLHIR